MIQTELSTTELQAINERLDALTEILPEIGQRLVQMQKGDLDISTKTNPRDLVTAADLYSEKALIDFINDRFGDDQVLGEESNAGDTSVWRTTVEGAEFCWVLDPVDGTVNYSHGLPLFSISAGLNFRGKPVAGLVFAPAINELYRAVRGQGATLNGETIKTSDVKTLSGSVVATGFPYNRANHVTALLKSVELMMEHAQGLRRTGAASVDMCWTACGRLDAFYEYTLSPWDTCAAMVVIQEAGGRVTGVAGQDYEIYNPAIAGSNGHVHDELIGLLNQIHWKA